MIVAVKLDRCTFYIKIRIWPCLDRITLCGSRMLFQDIRFFYGWLSNRNSQLKIDFIGLVYMVLIDAHSISVIMKITTTCSLNAPILMKGYHKVVLIMTRCGGISLTLC
jgi:hypothetical protein